MPLTVQHAFKLGAAVFILAVLWTVVTSREYPPEDMEALQRAKHERKGFHLDPKFLAAGALAGARCWSITSRFCDLAQSNWVLDIGFERALLDWTLKYRSLWSEKRIPLVRSHQILS